MKVLWFEISVPARYKSDKSPEGGWQDSLEYLVRQNTSIELSIAFVGTKGMVPKTIDKVRYIPLVPSFSIWEEKVKIPRDRWCRASKVVPLAVKCVEEVKPDLIHVFGTEWEFGQVAKYTDIPVVIHMQGCIAPYNNALYPPGYSISDSILQAGLNVRKQIHYWETKNFHNTWENMEQSNFQAVSNYMGRTEWDRQLVELFHPGAKYFHVEEALRPSFINNPGEWKLKNHSKLRLITVGCSTYWKGMDTLLKTAHVLTIQNIDFEWLVCGKMGMQKEIERKEKMRFADNNVKILGFTKADKVKELLLSSDIYVHTAYIENSPNSICEAQYLGVPIISTNVGGIFSLVKDKEEGVLVPANSCYNMAFEIISLAKDKSRQMIYSENSKKTARRRHAPSNIIKQLLDTYNNIIISHEEFVY